MKRGPRVWKIEMEEEGGLFSDGEEVVVEL